MKLRSIALALLLTLPLAACHSSPPVAPMIPETSAAEAPAAQTVSCTVCEHEGDMACMKVKLEADTPAATFEGTRYYFCSEECRDEFLKNPKRYTN